MVVNRTQLLATFAETSATLENLTASLTEEQLNYRSAPAEWSIREILAHLVDDEMFVMRVRLERAVKETNPEVADNDEKAWYQQRNTSRDAITELLYDFTVQRAASLNILTFLRESDWTRTFSHAYYGTLTVESWLEHWVEHDLVHIHQIEGILAACVDL